MKFQFLLSLIATAFLSQAAFGQNYSFPNNVIAKCKSDSLRLLVLADSDTKGAQKLQEAQLLASWGGIGQEDMETFVLYDKMTLKKLGPGHVQLTGTIVLPIPIGAPQDVSLELKNASGSGKFGETKLNCRTTSYFQNYNN